MDYEQSLFSFVGSKKIGIYIDYSNLYHAKYTLWWEYNISQFFAYLTNDKIICHVWFYGAYDKTNIKQFARTQKLQRQCTDPKFHFYFKKLEKKGNKQKGNVDTEMGYDIANHKNMRDTIILFSWDGDFLYVLDSLLVHHQKKAIIISTKWHINQDLISYTQWYDVSICRFIDIQQEKPHILAIKDALKAHDRWVCIPPELLVRIDHASAKDILGLQQWCQTIIDQRFVSGKLPILLEGCMNKNDYLTYKTILHRKREEKEWLLEYLTSLVI